MGTWQLQDAKNRFSALVEAALSGEPQEVTRRGIPVVIVSSYEGYQRLVRERDERAPSFRDLLLAIPQGSDGDGFELPERTRDHTNRAVDL